MIAAITSTMIKIVPTKPKPIAASICLSSLVASSVPVKRRVYPATRVRNVATDRGVFRFDPRGKTELGCNPSRVPILR